MGVRGDCDPGALGFVTSNAFAQLPWFRELVWIGLWLLCLALIGRRSVPIQNGRAHNSGNDSLRLFLLDRSQAAVLGNGR